MALDVELNRNQFYQTGVSPVFVVSQNLFCVFFLAELLIRTPAKHESATVGQAASKVAVSVTSGLCHSWKKRVYIGVI